MTTRPAIGLVGEREALASFDILARIVAATHSQQMPPLNVWLSMIAVLGMAIFSIKRGWL